MRHCYCNSYCLKHSCHTRRRNTFVKVDCYINETPTVCGLATDNNNKVYMELMIFLWNNHYNLNFNVGLSDNSKK